MKLEDLGPPLHLPPRAEQPFSSEEYIMLMRRMLLMAMRASLGRTMWGWYPYLNWWSLKIKHTCPKEKCV